MKTIVNFDFDAIKKASPDCHCYCDGDVAYHDSIGDIPFVDAAIRLGVSVILGCRAGQICIEINGCPLTIRSNEVIILKSNDTVSEISASPDFEGAVMCLSFGLFAEYASNRNLWRKIYQLKDNPIIPISEQSARMLDLYSEIVRIKTRETPNEFTREIIFATTKAIINEIAANIRPSVLASGGAMTQGEVLFKKFIELISHKRIKPRSVEWYARQLCVTPKYLTLVCKTHSGKTALDIINEFVFGDIRSLLKNSDKSIKEIANYLDFPSLSFFGKYVKARTGMSPTGYRRVLIAGKAK